MNNLDKIVDYILKVKNAPSELVFDKLTYNATILFTLIEGGKSKKKSHDDEDLILRCEEIVFNICAYSKQIDETIVLCTGNIVDVSPKKKLTIDDFALFEYLNPLKDSEKFSEFLSEINKSKKDREEGSYTIDVEIKEGISPDSKLYEFVSKDEDCIKATKIYAERIAVLKDIVSQPDFYKVAVDHPDLIGSDRNEEVSDDDDDRDY